MIKPINDNNDAERSQILGVFFYFSGLLAIAGFLYYVLFYLANGWWHQPTTRGKILLVGLFAISLVSGYLGWYFYTFRKKALIYAQWLTSKFLFIFLTFAALASLCLSLLIVINPPFFSHPYIRALHNYPVLLALAMTLSFAALFTLISSQVKSVRGIVLLHDSSIQGLKNVFRKLFWQKGSWLKLLQKNWLHLVVWLIMLTYFFIGPTLYANFSLRNGKTFSFTQPLPERTADIKFYIDGLQPIKYDGQDLYKLFGWSFYLKDADQMSYARYIVLQSDTKTYFFSTDIFKRPTVQETFKDLQLDLLYSGYTSLISKDVIRPGDYHVGIVFDHKLDQSLYFFVSGYTITRTPNQLILRTTN